jgi:Protein of unknown function (DUF1566)
MYRYCLLVGAVAVAGSFGSAVAAETFPPPVQRVTRTIAVGNRMDDGTIWAGISPETNGPLYTTPEDAWGHHYNWNEAAEYCRALDISGQRGWHVPTKDELSVLYSNHDAIGGFDTSGRETVGWYWSSSSEDMHNAWALRFSDGDQYLYLKKNAASVRCVR